MSAEIIPIHSSGNKVDKAWDEYCALAQAMRENPELATDWRHVTTTLRAFDNFSSLFLAEDRQS